MGIIILHSCNTPFNILQLGLSAYVGELNIWSVNHPLCELEIVGQTVWTLAHFLLSLCNIEANTEVEYTAIFSVSKES